MTMFALKLAKIATAVFTSVWLSCAQAPSSEIYTFGQSSYWLDLRFLLETTSPHYFTQLENCSDGGLYCYRPVNQTNSFFNVVLPRRCRYFRHQQAWSRNGVTTRKIGRRGRASDRQWYLTSDDHPDVVFVYAETRGIVELYRNPSGRDFAGDVRNGVDPAAYPYSKIGGVRDGERVLLPCS